MSDGLLHTYWKLWVCRGLGCTTVDKNTCSISVTTNFLPKCQFQAQTVSSKAGTHVTSMGGFWWSSKLTSVLVERKHVHLKICSSISAYSSVSGDFGFAAASPLVQLYLAQGCVNMHKKLKKARKKLKLITSHTSVQSWRTTKLSSRVKIRTKIAKIS